MASAMISKMDQELVLAQKSKNEDVVSCLRMIKSACKYKQVELKRELTDEDVIDVLSKQAKQRRESIDGFEKGNRPELVAKEKAELALIETFLPQQLTEAEVVAMVQEAIKASGAASVKDMGKVMGILTPKVKGKTDMGKLSGLVKKGLGA